MANTKDFIPIEKITEDVAIMKDGSVALIIQTSAVNFDLLSEQEQLAIIGSFAALLNSLSFSIQILIRSKKLDISHYLNTLKEAERKQHNPLLQLMMQHYRAFVAAIIRDNEVLDKQFYVILSVSQIELGVVKSSDTVKNLQKAMTILVPRRDNILKQLSRIGLKSEQLNDEKLIRLFYDIYNDPEKINPGESQPSPQPTQTPQPQPAQPQPAPPPPIAPVQPPQPTPMQPTPQPAPITQSPAQPAAPNQNLYSSPQSAAHNPFVVEELPS